MLLCYIVFDAMAQKQTIIGKPYHPPFEKATIKDFLEEINAHSGTTIEYASNSIEGNKVVLLTGQPHTIGAVLKQVLYHQMISVVEKNNKLILVPSTTALSEDAFSSFYAVYGIIKESSSKEPLADASIWQALSQKGTHSNTFGYYTILLSEGQQTMLVSYAGYNSLAIPLNLNGHTRVDVELSPKTDAGEVIISSFNKAADKNGSFKVSGSGYPQNMIMGESDMVRSLYLLPGVQNAPQVTNGMLVRGGSPDQNIFLLDGNPIFNPTHMLGTLSIVNKTSLKSIHLYKSSFPARFGGGLSSVVDVVTKDGNMQEWKGEANTGLLAGSFTLEGPIVKNRSSMMVSYRHSLINPFLKITNSGINIRFYDLHLKLTNLLNEKNKLMLNIYAGHDKMKLQQDNSNNQQQWGNQAASLMWNRILGKRAFVNTTVGLSSYKNIAGFRYSMYDSIGYQLQEQRVYNTFSSVQQFNAQSQVEMYNSNAIKANIGARISYTWMKPFNTNVAGDFIDKPEDFNSFPTLSYRELVLFYENEIKFNGKFFLRPGLHYSNFNYNRYRYNSLQPRLYATYKINRLNRLELSYNHMTQYLHLVTNPYLGINSDAWIPSTSVLKPEESDLFNLGYTYQNNRQFVVSAEIYYKQFRRVTNYVEGKNLFLNNADWEQNVQSGRGWVYGLEVKADKKTAHWQTHVGYTLAWNWRRFNDINEGKKFPFKYDRRHVLNIAVTYQHRKHWDFSALWNFATGDVFTLPDRIYPDFDAAQQVFDPLVPREYRLVYHSSATNQYRTLAYHRLDVSAGYHQLPGKKTSSMFTVGVYNIYGSPSQYLYDLEGTLGKRSLLVSTQYKLFSITPYLSYTVNF